VSHYAAYRRPAQRSGGAATCQDSAPKSSRACSDRSISTLSRHAAACTKADQERRNKGATCHSFGRFHETPLYEIRNTMLLWIRKQPPCLSRASYR